MAYTTINRVRGLLATFTIDAQSAPTEAQAVVMIDETAAEIDAVLNGIGVGVPVALPTWFVSRLSLLNSYGAAAMILKAGYPEASGPGESPAYAFWEKRYQDGLKLLRTSQDIPGEVVSTITTDSGMSPSSYFTRNPDEEEILGDIEGESWFKVGQVF